MLLRDVNWTHPSRMDCCTRPLRTKSEQIIGQVESLDGLKVARMNRASLVFKNEHGAEFYATRKVANLILAGTVGDNVLLITRTLTDDNGHELAQDWLALPSIF